MGKYRLRLSDMIPNAWFYKLKEMARARNHNNINTTTTTTHSSMKTKQHNASTQQLKPNQPYHHHSYPRKSYYINRDLIPCESRFHNSPTNPKVSDPNLPDPPRKSSKKKHRRRPKGNSPKLVSSSVSAGCNCRATIWTKSDSPLESSPSPDLSGVSSDDPELQFSSPPPPPPPVPEFRSDQVLATNKTFDEMVSWSTSFGCEKHSSPSSKDIVIDMGDKFSVTKLNNLAGFDQISNLDLPPIITKPSKFSEAATKCRKSSVSIAVKEQKTSPVIRRLSVTSPGVRLRINSPRLMNRKIQGRKSLSSNSTSRSRRSLSDSLAIVKSSFNPQKDFRDSMVEMIMENNIRASKDLEELLACYLSLNSDEYHDLIIKVFKQIWFDLTDIRVK
ncbi:AF4/FMR2 family member 1 [Tripterygium wilfordii]|uniref:Transcription repressor n=1 Tax=Tripterygium wilfordii TaxID=458696 RepID=A0A7J7DWP8_TRIWF|nr:transcription repressor OFP1-like [Tripterygium wilfordii]KAF5750747.1 AF4/FMR2 family member 1 [Tripterygium wilfordii]